MAEPPYVCYRELVPSTSVVQSAFFRSYSTALRKQEEYIITLLAGGINIYKVCKESSRDGPFLSLQCHRRLFGKPNSIAVLKAHDRLHDLVAIGVDNAKTIVFRCNMEENALEVVLLCNCEENAFGPGSELQVQLYGMRRYPGLGNDCKVCVSEDGVVCNTIYSQYLAVLPIPQPDAYASAQARLQDDGTVSHDAAATESGAVDATTVAASGGFVVDIGRTLGLTGPIIDTCFLPGYSRPVLLVLQQSGLLPIGHAARVRHCCTLTALAVGAGAKTLSVLWQRTHLPYDALRLVPLTHPAYAGAVCVICMNAVILVNQEEAQGVAMNGFAAVTVCTETRTLKNAATLDRVGVKSGDIGLQSWVSQEEGLELDGSHWIEPSYQYRGANGLASVDSDLVASSRHEVVGTLKDGTILRVGLAMSTPGMLSSVLFTPEIVASSVRASCFSASPSGELWFLGSRQATCVLMGVDYVETTVGSPRAAGKSARAGSEAGTSFLSPATKRQRSVSVVSNEDDGLLRLHTSAVGTPSATPSKGRAVAQQAVDEPAAGEVVSVEEEELALYGGSLTATHVAPTASAGGGEGSPRPTLRRGDRTMVTDRIDLSVMDSFPVLGPVLDGILTKQDGHFDTADALAWERQQEQEYRSGVQSTAASYIAEREARDGLILAAGLDEDGALLRVHQGLHLNKVALRNLPGAVRVLSVQCDAYSVLLVVYEDKTRTLHCTQESHAAEPKLAFKELSGTDCGLISTSPTLNVGLVHDSGELIVAQVVPQGVRLVRLGAAFGAEGDPVQDVLVADSQELGGLGGEADETVLAGDVCAGYVTLLTSTHSLYVLKYDSTDESLELVQKIKGGGDASTTTTTVEGLRSVGKSELSSVSLYYGTLDVPVLESRNGHASQGESLSLQQQEEILLYGAVVDTPERTKSPQVDSATEAPMQVVAETHSVSPAPATTGAADVPQLSMSQPQAYMLVTELSGALSIVQLAAMQCVFHSASCASLPDCLKQQQDVSSSAATLAEGLVIETRLARLYDAAHPDDRSRSALTLALLLSTGDLVAYRGAEPGGFLHAFHKTDQCSVTNKRAPEGSKLVRNVDASNATVGADDTLRAEREGEHRMYLHSQEYSTRGAPSLTVAPTAGGARGGILVTGNDALIVTNLQGLPSTLPLGFPEVPFINHGQHSVVPLWAGNGMAAIAALWFEWEDLDSLKAPPGAAAAGKGNRAATLGIYQQVPGLELYPAGGVSVRRLQVGRTVHRVAEVLNHTDDRTQQALLEKKTFLLACSEERRQPFLPSVLTEEELQEDSEMYERYYTSLESFCQPDSTVGQAPTVASREHSLALVQGTSVVDTYALPLNECVIDAEVLYLNLEKYITMPGNIVPMRFTERRVFVAACTALVEKRGEDTQGNGRLLFFALDYALFEKDTETTDATSSAGAESADAVTAAAKAIVSNADTGLASAQAKFLGAIKPKLRLLWTGPGPASVVRQLGEYVLSTVASTVYVYKFNTGTMDLEQVSFFFTQLYITSVTVIKNYILVGDMHHSVQLLCWREADHSLSPVGRDFDPAVPLCTEFLYDGSKLGMVMTDDEGNLQMFQENPRKPESIQGSRLLGLADFHIGSDASLLLRHDLLSTDAPMKAILNPLDYRPPPPPPRSRKGSNFPLQRYATRLNKATFPPKATLVLGTMDGGLALLQPLEERMYRRLALLQQIMTMTVQTNFALNPREYRLLKSAHMRVSRKKGVLDGCLLSTFTALPPSMQDQLAATVGATAYLIKENLHELDYLCRYF